MVLNIISTVNGIENEGMRNIASHMTRELKGMCTVRSSALGNPLQCAVNSVGADAVLIFARAIGKAAYLARLLRRICYHVYFVFVQKPEADFFDKLGRDSTRCGYFTLLRSDAEEAEALGGHICTFNIGIDRGKFYPAESRAEKSRLRAKYGFSDELPLVLHVGHLSEGRGLEEFLHLPKEHFSRLVVASGMFSNDETEKRLAADGVRIIKEYLPNIGEIYRMADVYVFPTRSAEYVISIPLSVTEALACGVPVVTFKGVEGFGMIRPTKDGALTVINGSDELEAAVIAAAGTFFGEDLLADTKGWDEVAGEMLADIKRDLEK